MTITLEKIENLQKKLIDRANNMTEFDEEEMTYIIGCVTLCEELPKMHDLDK